MPTTNAPILVVGHICLDLTPALAAPASVVPGHLHAVGPMRVRPGGCVANTATDLAELGLPVRVGGDLGADALADVLRDLLARRGLDPHAFRAATGTTSYSIVIEAPGADRTFWHHVGANADFDGRHVVLGDATVVHVGYPPLLPALVRDDGTPLAALLQRARRAGVATSIDLAVVDGADAASRARWQRVLQRTLPLTDVISPSLDDLLSAVGRKALGLSDSHEEAALGEAGAVAARLAAAKAARWLVAQGAAIAMVSAGPQGLALATAGADRFAAGGRVVAGLDPLWHDTELTLAATPVAQVITTTGAGDAASAGLLAGLVQGLAPGRALHLAAEVATAKISGRRVRTIAG